MSYTYLLSKRYFLLRLFITVVHIHRGLIQDILGRANLSSALNVNLIFQFIHFGPGVLIKGQNGHGDSRVC